MRSRRALVLGTSLAVGIAAACSTFSSNDTSAPPDGGDDAPAEAAAGDAAVDAADAADDGATFDDPLRVGTDDAGVPVTSCALGKDAVFLGYADAVAGLRRMDRDGGAVSGLDHSGAGVVDLAADDFYVYWIAPTCNDGLFRSTGTGGATPQMLGVLPCSTARLSLGGSYAYLASTNGFVGRAMLMPTGYEELARYPAVAGLLGALASDGTSVYLAMPNAIVRMDDVPDAGGTVAPLVDAGAVLDLVFDGTHGVLWWATAGDIGNVQPDGGGLTVTVASTHVARIAVEDAFVHWIDPTAGRVWRVPRDGSSAPTYVSAGGNPIGIGVDATGVFWCNADGSVWTMRRR